MCKSISYELRKQVFLGKADMDKESGILHMYLRANGFLEGSPFLRQYRKENGCA